MMKMLQSFALDKYRKNFLMSLDFKSEYFYFYIFPDVRNASVFWYIERFYRCLALTFEWVAIEVLFLQNASAIGTVHVKDFLVQFSAVHRRFSVVIGPAGTSSEV